MNNPTVIIVAAVVISCIVIALVVYLLRSNAFRKGEHGRNYVANTLKRYASGRKATILSDVTVSDGEQTAEFDHVLIGYFGVLFLQSIQGSGSFWGDGKQDTWAFADGENKLLFKNPLDEMEEKIKIFRRALAQNKVYKVPVERAVVIVSLGDAPKMYLSNISDPDSLLLDSKLSQFLRQEKFEKDNGVQPEVIAKLFSAK